MQRSGRDEDGKTCPRGRGQVRREATPPGPTSRGPGQTLILFLQAFGNDKISSHIWPALTLYFHSRPVLSGLGPAAAPLVISSPCIFSLLESQGTEPRTLLLLFLVSSPCLPGHLSMGSGRSGCLCTFCVPGAGTAHLPLGVSRADSRAMQGSTLPLFFRPAHPEPGWTHLSDGCRWPSGPLPHCTLLWSYGLSVIPWFCHLLNQASVMLLASSHSRIVFKEENKKGK